MSTRRKNGGVANGGSSTAAITTPPSTTPALSTTPPSSALPLEFVECPKYGKCGGSAGLPLTKSEASDGKKTLSNGMVRVHRVLSDEEVAAGRATRWSELEIHGKVRIVSDAVWEMRHLTALFLQNNQLARLPPTIAQLNNLTVLDLSNNKLRSLPAELGDMISLCNLQINDNQIRLLPYELGKLFRLQTLGLKNNPLNPEIAKIYHEPKGTQKLRQYLLDHLAINTHPPPERSWVMIRHADPDKPIATFTVLCYNVLCDKYASATLYTYCPAWALNWEYRKQSILKEIRHYEADIVTLQEVETEQYNVLFRPTLAELGYEGIFSPKSRARTMNEEERKYVDGCAIFWKKDKFEMERKQLIEFTQIAIDRANTSEHMLNRVMPRDNIALCAVLRVKEAVYAQRRLSAMSPADNVVGNPLVVCTAHIHWDPELCDVKLVQSMMLLHELYNVLRTVAEEHRLDAAQIPVLICGDLNSVPDSGVFEYLSRGTISRSHGDLKGFRDDACLDKFSSSTDSRAYTHSLRLDSAVDPSAMPFTNYTLEFKGMIDYIFSTPQSLARLGVLGQLDAGWLQTNRIIGFPHPHVPSDHIPIMAQYAIIPTSHQRPVGNGGGNGAGLQGGGGSSSSLALGR